MKIILLGGGSGGHFYPLIAVARALRDIQAEEHIVNLKLTFMSDTPFDEGVLREEDIIFEKVSSGKIRRYFSLKNIFSLPKIVLGIAKMLWRFSFEVPDVIFSKGGYTAFPVLVAARIYKIPIMIHESDSLPGKVNQWAGRFAKRVAISFPETQRFFAPEKTALTGHPIRKGVLGGTREEALTLFQLEETLPTLLVLGGSQGARQINETLVAVLSDLLPHMQVIHQCGVGNYEATKQDASIILENNKLKNRYHLLPFLEEAELRNASHVSDIVVSRAGAGAIFEIAAWAIPAILIPLSSAAQNHQRENAYNYMRSGAAEVIEQGNLKSSLLVDRILKIIRDKDRRAKMKKGAQSFSKIDAARRIAKELTFLGTHG